MISILLTCLSLFVSVNSTIYDFTIKDIDGKEINFSDYKGKKILLVNVASKCGYTKQYKELQELYIQEKESLIIVGLPCNQFLHQEPGTNKEIKTFCTKNYGVTFPITEKINVKGNAIHPIYKWLTKKSLNGLEDSKVKWNFQKYLIDENGNLIKHFEPSVTPLSSEILEAIKG